MGALRADEKDSCPPEPEFVGEVDGVRVYVHRYTPSEGARARLDKLFQRLLRRHLAEGVQPGQS